MYVGSLSVEIDPMDQDVRHLIPSATMMLQSLAPVDRVPALDLRTSRLLHTRVCHRCVVTSV